MRNVDIQGERILMSIGMLLIILGGILLLIINPQFAGCVGWGCGGATAIYASSGSAIKKLRKHIEEIEK